MEPDVIARAASMMPNPLERMPRLVALGFGQAFPSLSQGYTFSSFFTFACRQLYCRRHARFMR
eukprot:8245905-Pyramimonas_sp.AAC.1